MEAIAGLAQRRGAGQIRQEIEESFDPAKAELSRLRQERAATRVSILDAVTSYLSDAQKRNLALGTLYNLRRTLTKKLLPWAEDSGLVYLDELTTAQLTTWRSTWLTLGPTSTQNNQNDVVAFFSFCVRQQWCRSNPASRLSRIRVPARQTDYFRPAEFERLLDATDLYGVQNTAYSTGQFRTHTSRNGAARIYVFLLLLRFSGLRIGDAATLERKRLLNDRIALYQAKTGLPVCVPLPPEVCEALRNVPPGPNPNPRYFFGSGRGSRRVAGGVWRDKLARVFELADLRNADGSAKRCHAHMIRHTFSIELLLAGVPIEQVSMLLGHSSTKTTEKYYAPWVRERQQQLETSVRKAWSVQEMATTISNSCPTDRHIQGHNPDERSNESKPDGDTDE